MHAWEAIQKTLNHIDEHIDEQFGMEELASLAALSVFYYQRLFAKLVKRPVREYIKLRRLARACVALRNKQNRITDVALDYGFGSHEVFTRAFKEAYGMTPAQYRDKPISLNHFDKPDLLLNYIMVDEGVPLIHDGIVLEYNRKTLAEPVHFMGVEDFWRFKYGKMLGERPGVSEPGEVWSRFFRVRKDIPRKECGRTLGVSYPGVAPEGYSTYFVGAEIEAGTEDARFVNWTLPAREYVVCSMEVENSEKYHDALGKMMKFTRTWLKSHGLRAELFFPEIYYNRLLRKPHSGIWPTNFPTCCTCASLQICSEYATSAQVQHLKKICTSSYRKQVSGEV